MEFLMWWAAAGASWLLYTLCRRRWANVYARAEAQTATHPWLNAGTFAVPGFVVAFTAVLLVDGDAGEALVVGAFAGGLLFLFFVLASLSFARRYGRGAGKRHS